jgi:hypothetical protein
MLFFKANSGFLVSKLRILPIDFGVPVFIGVDDFKRDNLGINSFCISSASKSISSSI